MTAEMERVKTAQITYAVRTTNIDGMDIEKGDIMAYRRQGYAGSRTFSGRSG